MPHPLSPSQTRVRIHGAATGGIIYSIWILYGHAPWQFFVPARRFPTWFRWRRSGRKAESESGGDGLLANPRIVARRRFQTFGRRHRNRSGGFCCFSPSKSREKRVFSERRKRTSRGFLLLFATEKQRKRKKIVHVLLRPKVPKASARRFPRECASRGAARGAQDQAYAPPRGGRAAARTLFFRVKRECGFIVPPAAALLYNALWKPVSTYLSCPPPAACHFCFAKPTTLATPFFLFPQGDSRLGSDGEKADGGLKATAAGTVCLQTRAVARRRFQPFGRRHRNRSGGFCCFSTPKSREKRKSFPQEDRKSQKVFERTFAAAFRHRKAEKKRRRGTKTHLRTGKSADHGCRPRRRYNKREKTDCRQGPGLRQRATPLPRSPATRGGARCSGRHTNTPARCAAPACVPPPARPA